MDSLDLAQNIFLAIGGLAMGACALIARDLVRNPTPPLPDGEPGHGEALYITGTGQQLGSVHQPDEECAERCVVHNASDHSMRAFPTHWRGDKGMMERICPHGIGHPDPDDIHFKLKHGAHPSIGVHGCDGCCAGAYDA